MPTMTSGWTAEKKGKSVEICHGDLSSMVPFEEANMFALSILQATGYKGLGGQTDSSKTATAPSGKGKPGAKSKKKPAKGKGC